MQIREKAKVLLIQPPIYDFALYDLFFKPYGLLRLAQWFLQGSYEIEILNCLDWTDSETVQKLGGVKRKANGTGKFLMEEVQFPFPEIGLRRKFHRYGMLREVIKQRIASAKPDIVCITSGMTYWYQGVWEILDIVQEQHPHIPIAVGGVYAALLKDHIIQKYPDVRVVSGGGVSELNALLIKSGLPGIQGVFPYMPLIDRNLWNEAGAVRLNDGCPMNCDYCASRLLTDCFVPGDPYQAASWLKEFYHVTGLHHIAFYDDALLVDKSRVLIPFLEEIIRSGISFQFYTPNGLHISGLDAETASLMYKAGFQEIRMGFESSSDEFHKAFDDKSSMQQFRSAVETALTAGFSPEQLRVYVLAGLPKQLWQEVMESIRAASCSHVAVSVAEYSPVPGTALWAESCRESRFPLAAEPLFHNNTIQPMEWEGFTREDMNRVKQFAQESNRKICRNDHKGS